MLLIVAAVTLAAALAGVWLPPAKARWVGLAVALVGLVVILATRRAWEFEVRRPTWITDASRGRWLERGVDWLLASLALVAAASLRSFGGEPSRRAWTAAALAGALSLAALAWGGWA